MGIPSLFRTIIHKYSNTHFWDPEFTCENLFFDYNNLIHDSSSNTLRVLSESKRKYTNTQIETEIINNIIQYTLHVIDVVNPSDLVYIAIDGSVPYAKMHLQRARRYKSVADEVYFKKLQKKHGINKPSLWNKNNITPGTSFMKKLNIKIIKMIKSNVIVTKNVIFSNCNIPGEGEHKIFQYIKQHNIPDSKKVCIYGADADLIMLGMASKRPNVFLIREPKQSKIELEQYTDIEFLYFSIDGLKESLVNEYQLSNLPNFNINTFINDFICITMFVGNDFVKSIKFLSFSPNPRYDGWNILLMNYIHIYKLLGVTLVIMEDDKPLINQHFLTLFIDKLVDTEQHGLRNLQNKRNRHTDRENDADMSPYDIEKSYYEHTPYYSELNPMYSQYINTINAIDYGNRNNVKKQYYSHFFGIDVNNNATFNKSCNIIVQHYLQSIIWTLNYYLNDIISWTFYYKCRVAPLPSDIQTHLQSISNINTKFKFILNKPFKPLEQLMFVLPPHNKTAVPKKYGELMTKTTSPIVHLYPKTFELDVVNGMKHIYSEALLPHFDVKLVLRQLKLLESTLTKDETDRNQLESSPFIYSIIKIKKMNMKK